MSDRSVQPATNVIPLRRRRETVTVVELIEWIGRHPQRFEDPAVAKDSMNELLDDFLGKR